MLKLIYRYVHVMAALLVSVTMAAQNGYDPDSPVEPGDVSIDTPVISQQRGMISIACATSDVTIYYTIDVLGNEGQDAGVEDIMAGNVYSAPFNATANTVIKAVAVNSHYQSEVAKLNVGEVLCFTPVIAFNEPKLEISTPQNGVTIRYTVDGSNPTLGSMVYSGALDINEPCTVKAIAEHELMATSEVAVYDIKRCDAVGYEYSENQYLVLTCATEKSTIHYMLEGNPEALYEDVLTLSDNRPVRFWATADGWLSSDTIVFTPGNFVCDNLVIAFHEPNLTISGGGEGAIIYYTTDGSLPTADSRIYNGTLEITDTCIVSAVAMRDGFHPSEVAVYEVKRCDAVGYEYSENQYLALTCATEKSTIHYMLEGNPEALYEDVLTLSDNRPVRFWATADGWLSSDTTVFTPGNFICDNLVIAFHEPNLTISGGGEEAIIYYTTDGSLPTADSRIYNGTLEITDTCIVSAVAMRDWFHPSEVAVYEVKRCAAVGYEYSDSQYLALVCATPESSIHYVPEEYPEALYEDVLTLSDNRPIRFWATADGWLSSDIGTFTPDNFTCGPVHVYIEGGRVFAVDEQNGHEVRLLANNETVAGGMSLCETSVDEAMQAVYGSETVAPLTFMAVSTHPYKHEVESEVVELPAYSRMDDDVFHIHVFIPGQAETIDWHASSCDIRHLALHGMLATSDYQYVCRLNPLVLNLNDVHSEMPNRALASCSNLAALIWDEPQTSGEWSLGTGNPNTIFYTTSSGSLPADANIVMNGVAQIVTLADGGNFYCPQPFEARRISYTHKYEQTTGDGYAAGWETLALPFDVQSIWHVDRHVEIMSLEALAQYIQPYDAGENSIMPKPFWLMEMGNDTWKRATGIKAGMPYIISMPNNDKYVSSSRLNGWVSFRAENVMVPATEQTAVEVGDFSFVPTTCVVERSSDIYVLNAYDESDTNVKPGSAFLAGWRDVSPFQAYIVSHGTQQNMFSIASIRTVAAAADAIVAAAADLEGVSRIYTIGGVAVRTATAPGLYIVNGKKVFVR